MLAPQYIMAKFQEFMEISVDGKSEQNEMLKELRQFNRFFQSHNYDPNIGLDYLKNQHLYQNSNIMQDSKPLVFIIENIPAIIQDKLTLTQKTMVRTGSGINGLYFAILLGLICKSGQFTKEGLLYTQINYLITSCQDKNLQGILQYLQRCQQGVQQFKEIAQQLQLNSTSPQLMEYLQNNGIQTKVVNTDINKLQLSQSTQLIEQFKRIMSVDIQQILYYKLTFTEHRLVCLNASSNRSFTIFVECDTQGFDSEVGYSVFYDQNAQALIRQSIDDFNTETERLIDNYHLQSLSEFQITNLVRQMRDKITLNQNEKRRQCLKCQALFVADINTLSGQISNFCSKCQKEFNV